MTNKEMYKKIRDVDCTVDELIDFSDDRGRRINDYFKENYSLESIKKCLNLYYDGKVSSKFLSEWAFDYSMILRGHQAFRVYREYEPLTCKIFLENLILILLEFIDEYDFETQYGINDESLRYYEKVLTVLDRAYTNLNDWSSFYCFDVYENEDGTLESTDEIILGCVNRKTREFFVVKDSENQYAADEDIAMIRLSEKAFRDEIEKYRNEGYVDLMPHLYEE